LKNTNIFIPALSGLIKEKFLPYLLKNVEKDGFLTAPYADFKNQVIEEGLLDLPSSPRFSHGYCAAQNRICLLVETHSLKPFENRVRSTLSMMKHSLNFLNQNYREVTGLNKKADLEIVKKYSQKNSAFPVSFKPIASQDKFIFKGFESFYEESSITGGKIRMYTDKPVEIEIPIHNKAEVFHSVIVPDAYIIPKEFSHIVEIIKLHGRASMCFPIGKNLL
jgi:hypothetical protein